MNVLKAEKLAGNLIQFSDPLGFRASLVLGRKRALLFDTMCGIGNIKKEVATVTDLPVTVVLSHSHFDHIGGAFFYREVWLSAPEQPLMQAELPHLEAVCRKVRKDGIVDLKEAGTYKAGQMPRFRTLTEGAVFDLGGITLRAVALPGHTAGSFGLLSEETGLLLVGDAVTPIMCLFFANSLPIREYIRTLEKISRLPFSYFITGHHARFFPKTGVNDFIRCARFALTDRGMKFQHDLIPEYTGTLHIYRGSDSEAADFLALIDRPAETGGASEP